MVDLSAILDPDDYAHFAEYGAVTLDSLLETFAIQARLRRENPFHHEPCWDCRRVEQQLKNDGIIG